MNSPVDRSAAEAAPTPPASDTAPATSTSTPRPCPIPVPSHALQFRAIGLVRGQYVRAEKINQGTIVVADESQTEIEAVLLGRTIGVVKNHVDLDKPHLWVVYPRMRSKEEALQLQIVGIWEPETLDPDFLPADADDSEVEGHDTEDTDGTDADADAAEDSSAATMEDADGNETTAVEAGETDANGDEATPPDSASNERDDEEKPKLIPPMPRPPAPPVTPAAPAIVNKPQPQQQQPARAVALPEASGEFSVRGEVVFYSEDAQKVVVKIKQAARQDGDRPKFFKLEMQGKLPTNRALRQFWDLLVRLEGPTLKVLDAVSVAPMKPKKRMRPQHPVRRSSNKKVIAPPQRADGAPVNRGEADRERPRPKRVIDRPRPQKREG